MKAVFDGARLLPTVQRGMYLDAACGVDITFRRGVEQLLEDLHAAGQFLEAPTVSGGTVSETLREGPGTCIGLYKLLEQIGEGGFGVVFMAEQERPVRRRVALKIIKLGMDTKAVIARFEAERQALALMDHPGIARVLDAGATETGRPYFVMELVKGEPVTRFCDKNNLGIRERLDLFVQICHAVQHAHTKGVIHRDVKPSNVLVSMQDARPLVKVIDFGIAKATAARLTEKTLFTEYGLFIGTPEYMSPEQAEGSPDIDTRTDVYALGVLLYELLTGVMPFDPARMRSAEWAELRRIIREVEPPGPSTRLGTMLQSAPAAGVPQSGESSVLEIARHRQTDPTHLRKALRGELDWIVMKCLEKDRTRRYETAGSLGADVLHYMANEPVMAGPPSRAYRLAKLVRRNRGVFAASAAVGAGVLVGLVVSVYSLVQVSQERDDKDKALLSEAALRTEAERSAQVATEKQEAAERSARRLAAIQDFFLNRILRSVDPDVAGGEIVTVRQVMDAAARDADRIGEPEVEAAVRHQVGAIYLSLRHLDEARPQLERALAIREGLTEPDVRPATAETMLALAQVLQLLEATGGGEDLVLGARAIRVEVFGEESLPVAEADYHLSETRLRAGKDFEAAEINTRALAMLGRLEPVGQESGLHAEFLTSQGRHLSKQGREAESAELRTRAVDIHRRVSGANSTRLATALWGLGDVLGKLGRNDEAERRHSEALEIRRRLLAPNHTMVAQSLQAIGVLRMRAHQPEEAEKLVREALDIYRATYGERHEFVANTEVSLAATLASQRKFADAAVVLAEAVDIYAQRFGADDARLAVAQSMRGGCLVRVGEYAQAEQLLLEAHRSLAATGLNPPALEVTARRLVELYQAWERPEDQARWEVQLKELQNWKK